jgi:hypothetical protein
MEGVFEISFGPVFSTFRRCCFRLYRRMSRRLGLALESWDTDRLYERLIAAEKDADKRNSFEQEHMWEQQQIEDQRAQLISDNVWTKARRLYLETPQLTGREDDPNWIQSHYFYGRSYLSRAAVADLRAKIRAERKARWEPLLLWSGWAAAIGSWVAIFFKN